jgi:hypothetical protein
MKKVFLFLVLAFVILMTLAFPVGGALAEDGAADTGTEVVAADVAADQPTTPYTWEYLATLAGATAATLLIVQFLKVPLDKVWKIPTRVFVYFVALVILLIATAFTTGLTIQNAPLAAVNAFLVALTAYGTYEVTFARLEHK